METQQAIIEVQVTTAGRIDKVLASLTDWSRSKIQDLVLAGAIAVNQQVVSKVNHPLVSGDLVTIVPPVLDTYLDADIQPYPLDLEVLYEDEYYLIVNKPSGILTHPTSFNEPDTLVNAALHYFLQKGIHSQPWMVHRLDKDTSGIIMIAKSYEALTKMQAIFNEQKVVKKYYALVHHKLNQKNILIDVPIARSFQNKLKMNPLHGKNPKPAQTLVELIENYQQAALISCQLLTGRTHQIRVHLRHINHPIINDDLYGIEKHPTPYKQYLHAYFLSFTHPFTHAEIQVQTPLPEEFSSYIKELAK